MGIEWRDVNVDGLPESDTSAWAADYEEQPLFVPKLGEQTADNPFGNASLDPIVYDDDPDSLPELNIAPEHLDLVAGRTGGPALAVEDEDDLSGDGPTGEWVAGGVVETAPPSVFTRILPVFGTVLVIAFCLVLVIMSFWYGVSLYEPYRDRPTIPGQFTSTP